MSSKFLFMLSIVLMHLSRWYVQFASLFYIIIYCYSLIYFVFRYDTFVISSIFACLMIIGELTIGGRILLKKDRQDTIFRKSNKLWKIYRSSYFTRWRRKPEGESERSQGGPTPPLGAGHTLAAPRHGVVALARIWQRPFADIVPR